MVEGVFGVAFGFAALGDEVDGGVVACTGFRDFFFGDVDVGTQAAEFCIDVFAAFDPRFGVGRVGRQQFDACGEQCGQVGDGWSMMVWICRRL